LSKQTWKSQSEEFFLYYGQRLAGLFTFIAFTYVPLHLCRVYSTELKWMAENHFIGINVAYLLIKDVLIYGYAGYISLIYQINHPFFEKYKSNTTPWPWQTDPEGYKKQRWETFKIFFFNMTVVQAIVVSLGLYSGLLRWSYDFDDLPSYPKLLTQFAFCLLCAEFYFYWTHRLAHTPAFYWIHKQHHLKKNTVVMDGQDVSIAEFLILDGLTVFGGILILGSNCHFLIYLLFSTWQLYSNLDDHAGYEFPWMFTKTAPWMASNTWHNYHHLMNVGNYSAHTIFWDCIFGTCKSYADHIDVMEVKKVEKDKITQICAYTS